MNDGGIDSLKRRGPLRRSVPALLVMIVLLAAALIFDSVRCRAREQQGSNATGSAATVELSSSAQFDELLLRDGASEELVLFAGSDSPYNSPQLKISPAQRARLNELLPERERLIELQGITATLRKELIELLRVESSNDQDIFDKVNRLNEAIADLHTARIRNILEVRKILSPQQRKDAERIAAAKLLATTPSLTQTPVSEELLSEHTTDTEIANEPELDTPSTENEKDTP
ncbi:MAG: periplasmic heavy metal sensor [Deltaproteobacteria bacterium]|nr:periplasmic heavy metal sensor [Deltaproteobacteria bacterium]